MILNIYEHQKGQVKVRDARWLRVGSRVVSVRLLALRPPIPPGIKLFLNHTFVIFVVVFFLLFLLFLAAATCSRGARVITSSLLYGTT